MNVVVLDYVRTVLETFSFRDFSMRSCYGSEYARVNMSVSIYTVYKIALSSSLKQCIRYSLV